MTSSIEIRPGRWLRRLVPAALAGLALVPTGASAVDRPATPQNLRSVFSAAQPGDTILLASGNYGRFEGGMKSGEVVLRPQPGAAVLMELYFNPAQNITVDRLKLTDILIGESRTKNITVRNSDIPGPTVIRTAEFDNANILFDRNVHRDWNACTDGCYDGRITLPGSDNQAASGVTIRNSEFRGGMSDGIQNGARRTKILNNTFHDLVSGPADGSGQHTDAIQLYGSRETLIKGNYFYHTGPKIMAPDGADHEIIEDNVFGSGKYPYAIMMWSDNGSIIRHNTLAPGGDCWFNLRCGIISLGQKTGGCKYADSCDPGTDTLVEDNILAALSVSEGKASHRSSYNLFHEDSARGQSDMRAQPVFVGGARPTSYADYKLAAGSPGRGDASDGLDRGIRLGAIPPASAAGGRGSTSIRVLSTLRSIRATGRLRLRIRTADAGNVVVSGRVRPGPSVARRARHSRKVIKLKRVSLGHVRAGTRTVSMKLSRTARRTLGRSRSGRLLVRMQVDSAVTSVALRIKR